MTLQNGGTDKRHINGFRKFQRAALKAVDIVARSLNDSDADCEKKARPVVKVSDMKSLVSAYKDAVIGERMVMGLDGAHHRDDPADESADEFCLRWVVDETAGPGGEDAAVE